MRTINIAHSPDADDIFMYYPIKFSWVNLRGFNFINKALDIESLNENALKSIYDISAISFSLYPYVKEEYALLKTAASFGLDYGPKLVKKKSKKLKKDFKVALSGKYTTNALLFKIAYPEARIVYKNFLNIQKAVLDGEVDAGVLIHESILNFDDSLVVEREIYDIWVSLVKENLPLPLGGMVIRRSIPINLAIKYEDLLIRAVKIAIKHKDILFRMFKERDLIRVGEKDFNKYISMYANDKSIILDDLGYNSLNKLYEIAFKKGFYPQLIRVEDYMIPSQYEGIRKN